MRGGLMKCSMQLRHGLSCAILVSAASFAAAQARPFPGPDVQKIYDRLLPQIEKIPAFDHHAHPGFSDDPDVDAMAAPPDASEALRTRESCLYRRAWVQMVHSKLWPHNQ